MCRGRGRAAPQRDRHALRRSSRAHADATVAVGGRDPEIAERARGLRASRSARPRPGGPDGATSPASRTTAPRWKSSNASHAMCRSTFARWRGWAPAAATSNSLPFMAAGSVRPGMVMFGDDGRLRRRRVGRAGVRWTTRSSTSTSRARTTSSPAASSPTTRSTASAEPTSRTSSSSTTTSPTPTSSGSSRTTARRRPSSAPPTRSSPTTAGARSSRCGRSWGRGIPSRCASSPTSTPRRGS